MDSAAYDLHGIALLDYWKGEKDAVTVLEYRDGRTRRIPASIYFRDPDHFFPDEETAIAKCVGKVLVAGGGAGVHVLPLIEAGLEVTAIDVSAAAVEVMRARGIQNVWCEDFFEHRGTYDTVLLLGRNIGIAGTLSGLPRLLEKCDSLLPNQGVVIANSGAERREKPVRRVSGYAGEIEFRIRYRESVGSWVHWLHIDFDTLADIATSQGWLVAQIANCSDGSFAATLRQRANSESIAGE